MAMAMAMGVPPPAHLVGWRRLGGRTRIRIHRPSRRCNPPTPPHPVPAPGLSNPPPWWSLHCIAWLHTRVATSNQRKTRSCPSHSSKQACVHIVKKKGPPKIAMWPIEAHRNRCACSSPLTALWFHGTNT
jgi:hypothetical protein